MAGKRRESNVRRRGGPPRGLPSLEVPARLENANAKFTRQWAEFLGELTDKIASELPKIREAYAVERGLAGREDGEPEPELWQVDPYFDPETGGHFYAELVPGLKGLPSPDMLPPSELPCPIHTHLPRTDARIIEPVRIAIGGIEFEFDRAFDDERSSTQEFYADLEAETHETSHGQLKLNLTRQAEAVPGVDERAVAFAVDELPTISEPERNRFIKRQIDLISRGFKTGPIPSLKHKHFRVLKKIVNDGVRQNERIESIQEKLMQLKGVTKRRAETIARDQIGKYHGKTMEINQRKLGIGQYIWRTVGDERVRPEHRDREGDPFKWSDPPADGHPGQPVNCRCSAEPDLEAALAQFESK